MRMQVILDSSFARLGSAPIWDGKKGEFRDWTILDIRAHHCTISQAPLWEQLKVTTFNGLSTTN